MTERRYKHHGHHLFLQPQLTLSSFILGYNSDGNTWHNVLRNYWYKITGMGGTMASGLCNINVILSISKLDFRHKKPIFEYEI